jgi:hypothetical protein
VSERAGRSFPLAFLERLRHLGRAQVRPLEQPFTLRAVVVHGDGIVGLAVLQAPRGTLEPLACCPFEKACSLATAGVPVARSAVRAWLIGETLEPASRRWCNRRVARAAALGSALVAMLVLASPVYAAAPNYILVSGPGLKQPILLGNWYENGALLSALVDAPRAKSRFVHRLAQRPRFDLAEFWGWGSRPRPTRPSQANQHGWFYPAYRFKPPVIVLTVDGERLPRLVPASVLKILARHHVPLRL